MKRARSGGLIKNWQQRYRKDGQYTSRGLGVYPDVSLEQARALAVHFAMKDRPVTVRLLYGATDEQVAERMAPRRHELGDRCRTIAGIPTIDHILRHPFYVKTLDMGRYPSSCPICKVGEGQHCVSLYTQKRVHPHKDRPMR